MDVELNVRNISPHIVLEQPFNILCDITNRSDKIISPRLSFTKGKSNNIVPNGISGLVGELNCILLAHFY